MNELIRIATPVLADFLTFRLPDLAHNWWQERVLERLTFQQQRIVNEQGFSELLHLDFAALLRIIDQNWNDLCVSLKMPREGRSWVKELQTVRNKWAHIGSEAMTASEIYRDADTLGRFLSMLGAPGDVLHAVEATKEISVEAMANTNSKRKGIGIANPVSGGGSTRASQGFAAGDIVALKSEPAVCFPILEVLAGSNEVRYRVFQNGAKATYYESQLQAASVNEHRTLSARQLQAYLTSLHILSPSTAHLFSLRSGRVQFVPYQYRPVLKLIRSDRPRLLIADEVGVGKTIEAGLIIKELRARMDLTSVLIICPKALVAEQKWAVEMKRFDEHFIPLDGQLLRHCLHETHLEGEWPGQYAKALLPFSLFDSELVLGNPDGRKGAKRGLLSLDPPPRFDLVIVDEAHHIRNSETFLHQGIRFFCDNAEAVLFLSATPVQLGSEDLYTLLNVLRPDLVIDPVSFAQMAEPNRHINGAVAHTRAAAGSWQADALACLDEAASTEWGRLFLKETLAFQDIYDRLRAEQISDSDRVGLTRAIEELYTFSALVNRTRRRDIGEFTTRKPETVTVPFTPEQRYLHDTLLGVVSRILAFCHGSQNVKFMMTTIRRQAASCLYGLAPLLEGILIGKLDLLEMAEAGDCDVDADFGFLAGVKGDIQLLLSRARELDPNDPKAEAFVTIVSQKGLLEDNKVLVFSTFRHTLSYLSQKLLQTGLRYGVIHGGVSDEDRFTLRRRFAMPTDEPTAIDVLLSSEVGCEGLDFQFCNFLINYDLPWNPMRIEQRIGRIDRYGQRSEAVAIVNLITPDTVDGDIYERCLVRIGVFQHAIGGNEEILGAITKELHDIADNLSLTGDERQRKLRQLADNSIRRIREDSDLEAKQSEFFGLNIPTASWQRELEAAESYWLSPQAIQGCVSTYLASRLEKDTEYFAGEKPLKTLRLSQESRSTLLGDFKKLQRSMEPLYRSWEKWLKGSLPALSATFDPLMATETPETTYLSVLHPLVRQAADFLQLDEPAYVSLQAQSQTVPPGKYLFGLYRWKYCGAKMDEQLVAVTSDPSIDDSLLALLQWATDVDNPNVDALENAPESIESRHHERWSRARVNHIAVNRQRIDQSIQSLRISQSGRIRVIEDQIRGATNEKIRVMRRSELQRANADFQRRLEALQSVASRGDLISSAVAFGVITVW